MSNVLRLAIVDPNDSQRESLKSMLLGMEMIWLEAECSRYEFFAVEKVECSSDPGVKPPAAVPRMVELPTGTSGTSAGTRHRVRC